MKCETDRFRKMFGLFMVLAMIGGVYPLALAQDGQKKDPNEKKKRDELKSV